MDFICRRAIAAPLLVFVATIALATLPAIGQNPTTNQPTSSQNQPGVTGVDCSRIAARGIDKQANLHAAQIRIACGLEPPGRPGTGAAEPVVFGPLTAPNNANTISGTETYPKVTQSESSVWTSNGSTIVVNYNDSQTASSNYSGVSVSTNGGVTFTRLLPAPFASGHGTNFGDPILVYNAALAKWFAGDLVTGCGAQGIGLWTSTDGSTWTTGVCAHSGSDDDRDSMWVDNTSGSPHYGRMYISWNDFASGQRIFVTYSDNGTTWSAPVPLTAGFVRNVQMTGGPDGTVFVAAMNEGSGGLSNRTNLIYRSTDGGASWSQITMGAAFPGPGDSVCAGNSYFAMITPIWRHMGWGQPGVGPSGVVHYAYAGHGAGSDGGNIYYTRSTNNGLSWSAPIQLNTDISGHAQWMPSLSVTDGGDVHVYWYDRRNTTDGQNYEVWGRQSSDNGATWAADQPVSTVLIPQPQQPDSTVQACYAGDYNYATAFGTIHYATWTDGRVLVSGVPQQDVFFAAVAAGAPPPPDFTVSLNPASLTIPQGGSDTSTTTVASTNGFSGQVTLACTGSVPAGVTCTFGTNPVTPPPNSSATSLLTVGVAASVPAGSYSFDVQGTNGSINHSATLGLQVTAAGAGDFSMTCSPNNLNTSANFTKNTKCTVQSLSGFNGSVTLSCGNQPAGVTCTPAVVTPPPNGTATGTLTVTGTSVASGQYTFQAVGTSGSLVRTDDLRLRVR